MDRSPVHHRALPQLINTKYTYRFTFASFVILSVPYCEFCCNAMLANNDFMIQPHTTLCTEELHSFSTTGEYQPTEDRAKKLFYLTLVHSYSRYFFYTAKVVLRSLHIGGVSSCASSCFFFFILFLVCFRILKIASSKWSFCCSS